VAWGTKKKRALPTGEESAKYWGIHNVSDTRALTKKIAGRINIKKRKNRSALLESSPGRQPLNPLRD